MGLADTARHVIGCRLTQEARVQNASNDMASDVCPALAVGNRSAAYLALGRKVGLTLVHMSAQPEHFLSPESPNAPHIMCLRRAEKWTSVSP